MNWTTIKQVVTAFVLSFLFTIMAMGLLVFIVGQAAAQDSIRTYPARLGEQDRRLVTTNPRHLHPEHVTQYIVAVAEANIHDTASSRSSCHEQNLYLYYILVDLAKNLALHPEFAELYRPAIQSIHDTWCRQ